MPDVVLVDLVNAVVVLVADDLGPRAFVAADSVVLAGLEFAGMEGEIEMWDAVGRSHPMREPIRKLTPIVARMARAPRITVQAS